jgi:tRNA (guanine-N1)-methyltransferase
MRISLSFYIIGEINGYDHFITKEISIGDYVLSGGELGALVLSDASD